MKLIVLHANNPKDWKGEWVYLGISYLKMMAWEGRVKGVRHSLSEVLKKQIETQRQPFLNWIEEQRLANYDSLRWWMTHIAGRHYHGSMLFLYICQISALKSWVKHRSNMVSEVLVVCEDIYLMLAVSDNFSKTHQVEMQKYWEIAWLGSIFFSLARTALSILRQFLEFLKHHRVAKVTRPKQLKPPKGEVFLIHLTLGRNDFTKKGKITCPYFSFLPDWLEDKGKTVVRLPWINQIDIHLADGYKKLRESDCLIPEDWLNVKDYITSLWNSLSVVGSLKRSINFPGLDIKNLILRETIQQMYDGRAQFWRYGPMLEKWGIYLDKITLIDVFENMTPEHVLIAKLRNLGDKFRAIGYYHSLVGRDFLGYHFPANEWKSPILPDVIITNSVLGKKILIEQGAPENRVMVGPALRQQFKRVIDKEKLERKHILILLPTSLMDAAFEVLDKVAMHSDWLEEKKIPILVKPHPLSKKSDILDGMKWKKLPKGWKWVDGGMEEALKVSHCCITLATASAYDAILAGCIVLPMAAELNFSHNVLDILEDKFPELSAIASDSFKERIDDIFFIKRKEYIVKFNFICEKLLDGYGRRTSEAMETFL